VTDPYLRVNGACKRYGAIEALTDVSFDVRSGTIVGLVGPNGSGKSTLLGIIAGRVRPDLGSIVVDGIEHEGFHSPLDARHSGIELMPQEIAIVEDMSVADNISLGAEPQRRGLLDEKRSRQRALEALELLRLSVPLDARAGDLSPGEQRMLMIARTLHRKARVVIIDEPTAGLAPADAARVVEAVRGIRDSGAAVMYVSHYLDEVVLLADEAVGLRDGRVVVRLGSGEVVRDALLRVIVKAPESPRAEVQPEPRDRPAGRRDVVVSVGPLRDGRAKGAEFEVRRGELVGLAGLLGSGRADVVAAIAGSSADSAGPVVINGQEITSPVGALAAGLGHLSGDRAKCIIPSLDLHAHVTLPVLKRFSRLGIVRGAEEANAAEEALARAGIHTTVGYLSQLSGGNQQRALLARWLLADVDVLLVDEPTVGVDVEARGIIMDQLRDIGRRKALLLSSSEPEDLVAICDRVLCFKAGTIVKEAAGDHVTVDRILDAIS
jgi:ABC-type sugar transport system ATPase subunit